MGMFFGYSSKESIIKELLEDAIDHSLRGNVLYSAHKNAKGEVFIRVDLLKYEGGDYGYKPLSEQEHPYYYDCPKRILKLSTVPDDSGWRKACLERAANKPINEWNAFKKKLVVGQVYTTDIEVPKHGFTFTWDGDCFVSTQTGKRYSPTKTWLSYGIK